MGPCWPPRRPQDAPRTAQEASREAPWDAFVFQEAPRRPQDASRGSRFLGRILGRFGRPICPLFWRIFNSPRFFACGLSCNARPPCSRSAGSIFSKTYASDTQKDSKTTLHNFHLGSLWGGGKLGKINSTCLGGPVTLILTSHSSPHQPDGGSMFQQVANVPKARLDGFTKCVWRLRLVGVCRSR